MPDEYFLSKGSHKKAADGRCAMEWVAYLAGEPHSDSPKCVSRWLQVLCVNLNDRLSDEERQRLRPYLARTIGTAGDGFDGQRLEALREALSWVDPPVKLCAEEVCETCDEYAIAWLSDDALFALLDRMLPTEIVQLPAVGIEEAEAVCGVRIGVGAS